MSSRLSKVHRSRRRLEVITKLGGKCAGCGFAHPDALQVDHVYNDGAIERRVFPSYDAYMKHILLHIDTGFYQIYCANCNCIKEAARRRAEVEQRRKQKCPNGTSS